MTIPLSLQCDSADPRVFPFEAPQSQEPFPNDATGMSWSIVRIVLFMLGHNDVYAHTALLPTLNHHLLNIPNFFLSCVWFSLPQKLLKLQYFFSTTHSQNYCSHKTLLVPQTLVFIISPICIMPVVDQVIVACEKQTLFLPSICQTNGDGGECGRVITKAYFRG